MVGLSISGGATNFTQLASCAKAVLDCGIVPDCIIGVSSGAIMAVPIALGLVDEIIAISIQIRQSDFFKLSPVTEKGRISPIGILRAIFGYNSFGIQDIKPLLSKVVTPNKWMEYKLGSYADCYCMAVNASTGKRKVFDLKRLNYEDYLDAVSASCRIPVMTQPQKIGKHYYYDGGLLDHNASKFLINAKELDKLVSIYSRPKNKCIYSDDWDKNIITVIERTIDIMKNEITKNDETNELFICKAKGIDLLQLFNKSVDFLYQTDQGKLEVLGKDAYDEALNKTKEWISSYY